jgi:hypothetical protein
MARSAKRGADRRLHYRPVWFDPATGERQRFPSAIRVGTQVAAGGGGVATAVPARPLLLRFRAGAKFDKASSSDDPTNQQAVTLTRMTSSSTRFDYSSRGRAAIPLIVIRQCAVARRVVAP